MSETYSSDQLPESTTSAKRQALKTLAATGVIAGGMNWARPVVMSVTTPAHARVSDGPIRLTGGTEVSLLSSTEPSVLEDVLDAIPKVIRTAHADGLYGCTCNYFTMWAHCITIEMDGTGPDAMGTITIDGGSNGGTCSVTFELVGGDTIPQLEISTGCTWIQGEFNEDFTVATGTIASNGTAGVPCTDGDWVADLTSPFCEPGISIT